MAGDRYPYRVTAYYGEGVTEWATGQRRKLKLPPATALPKPGDWAVTVKLASESACEAEIAACLSRPEIGEVHAYGPGYAVIRRTGSAPPRSGAGADDPPSS